MKTIRKPLTDVYGRDFTTGKIVKSDPIQQEIGLKKKVKKRLKQKRDEAKKQGREDGKVFVAGLGRVNL